MGKGGGGSDSVVQTDLPEYARPYFEDIMKRSTKESKRKYKPYKKKRLATAGKSDLKASDKMVRGIAKKGTPGADYGGKVSKGLVGTAGKLGKQNTKAYGKTSKNLMKASGELGQQDAAQFTDEGMYGEQRGEYMDPYVQDVIRRGKKGMRKDFRRASQERAADAVQSGAFGGSRAAVMQAVAEGEMLDRMGDFEAEQRQAAFKEGRAAFEADRDARMEIEKAQAQEDMNQRQFQLETMGFTSDQAAELAAEQMKQREFQLDTMQFSADQAQQVADLEEAARAGDIQAAQMLESIGQRARGQEQAGLDLKYKDFLTQRDYGKDQLNFLNSIMRGMPVQSAGTQTTFQPYNPTSQALGTGLSALGLYKGLQ